MTEPRTDPFTGLTIGRSADLMVRDVCNCGGNESRTVWRTPGDLRNRHRDNCPAVDALSRLRAVENEAIASLREDPE